MHTFYSNGEMIGKEMLLRSIETNDSKTQVASFDTYPMYASDIQRIINSLPNNNSLQVLRLAGCHLPENEH